MRTNGHITIYNKYIDGTKRAEEYLRTQIHDVFWVNRKAANVRAVGGYIEADQATIYIPFQRGASYLGPVAWQALTLNNKPAHWTLQIGDVIARGLLSDDLIDADPLHIPPIVGFTLTDLKNKYDDVLVITSVDAKDISSYAMQHWQVGAQ